MKIGIGLATRGCDVNAEALPFIYECMRGFNAELICRICCFSAASAQEAIMDYALKQNFDYLLMMDSDVKPDPMTLGRMLQARKEIVSAPVWHYDPMTKDIHLNASPFEDVSRRVYEHGSGLKRIKFTSFACLLISRKALTKFAESNENPLQWSNLIDEKWKGRPSDNIFFEKAKKLDIEVYVDWELYGSVHYCRVELSDRVIGTLLSRVRR